MNIRNVVGPYDNNYYLNDNEVVIPISNARGMRKLQAWIDAGNTPTPYSGPSALEVWKQEMAASDALIPRWAEDLYDGLALDTRDGISAVTKNKIVQKKAKRELRPS